MSSESIEQFVDHELAVEQTRENSGQAGFLPREVLFQIFRELNDENLNSLRNTGKYLRDRVEEYRSDLYFVKERLPAMSHDQQTVFKFFIELNISGTILSLALTQPKHYQSLIALQQLLGNRDIKSTLKPKFLKQAIKAALDNNIYKLLVLFELQQLSKFDYPNQYDGTQEHAAYQTYRQTRNNLLNPLEHRFLGYNPTLLHAACYGGSETCLKFLLSITKVKQLINTTNDVNMTALHFAVASGDLARVKLLVTAGATLNIISTAANADHQGTPLHIACYSAKCDNEMLVFLLHHGANTTTKDANGQTALHRACRHRTSSEFAVLLIEHGADKQATNNDGKKPIDYLAAKPKFKQDYIQAKKTNPTIKSCSCNP